MSDGPRRALRVLRIALPLGALVLVVAIFAFPRPDFGGFDFDGAGFDVSDGLRLQNPRFDGETADGRPYLVTAQWALPDAPDPTSILLGPAVGRIDLSPDRIGFLSAGGGEFRPNENILILEEGVVARTSDGYRLTVERAVADIKGRKLETDTRTVLSAPQGELVAGAMTATRSEEGDIVRFTGGVVLTIDSARPEAGD